jgi:hypothetical protein
MMSTEDFSRRLQEELNTTNLLPRVKRNGVSFLHGACLFCQVSKSERVIRAEIYENQREGQAAIWGRMGDRWVEENPEVCLGASGGEDFSVAAFLFLCFILRVEKIKRIVEGDRRMAIEGTPPDSFPPDHSFRLQPP